MSSPASDEPSQLRVAVLPLANASGDPADAFIPAAIQEDLIGVLATLPDLQVFARDSLRRFAGDGLDPLVAARELKAGLVLTGSAGIAAGRLRVSLACLDASAGETLWRHEYAAGLGEAADIYAAVVTLVAETVGVGFPEAMRRRVSRRLPGTPLGFLSHLRGWYQLSLGTLESFQRAQDYFKASLQADGDHALSLVGMAESFNAIGQSGKTPPAQQMTYLIPGASEAALHALRQDPLLAEAHAARGRTLTEYTFDFAVAEQHLRRALRGEEGQSATHLWLGLTLAATGRLEEAAEQIRHALDRDPLSSSVRCAEALIRYVGGDYAEAARVAAAALELEPANWRASLIAGLAQAALGDFRLAEKAATEGAERSERHPLAVAVLGFVLASSGQKGGVVRLLNELQDASRSRYVPALALAVLQLGMGQQEAALASLERAGEEQNWLAFLHRTPLFDAVRADPRFRSVLEDSGVAADVASQASVV